MHELAIKIDSHPGSGSTHVYEQDLSQQEIAESMGVSRSLIALYLKKAREQGIVRIEVFNPKNSCEDLANLLKSSTQLNRVVSSRAHIIRPRLQDAQLLRLWPVISKQP